MIVRAIWLAMALVISCEGKAGAQEHAPLFIGVVHVPPDALPEQSFSLLRDGRASPGTREMQVLNGDYVLPLPGRKVTVMYVHPECGEKTLTGNYLVSCSPTAVSTAGGFLNLLRQLLPFASKLERMEEVSTLTTRGSEDISCLPPPYYRVSPWPPSGATLLTGERALFRWDGEGSGLKLCSPVTLEIVSAGEPRGEILVRQTIRLGELANVQEVLAAGSLYEWVVTSPDGVRALSPRRRLTVLDRESAARIEGQLAEVAAANPEHPAALVQALYLQVISDATPGLDLYADSLALLRDQDVSSGLFREVAARAGEHAKGSK